MQRRQAWLVVSMLMAPSMAVAQQVPDPGFVPKVARPAYRGDGPKVMFDEAHRNFHTATGRYKAFVDLVTADGYQVTANTKPLTRESLGGFAVLVIANARGEATPSDAALTDAECAAVEEWVRQGGALLLIADHAPYGAAASSLARRFGVDMSAGWTRDPANFDRASNNQGFIVYTRESGRLADHVITRGRDQSERLTTVMTFTGQSLRGPSGSVALLRLADTAVDERQSGDPASAVSAAGRAQALVLTAGKGRVAVMGEAAMLSAQLIGPDRRPFGMNRAGIDNQQWALNLMRWLTRALN